MALSTSANSAIPVGAFRKKPACDQAGAVGHAAGTLYVAPDGHVLMLHRSGAEENFAHHWALPGGGVDDGETPAQAAAREAREEMGYDAEAPKKILDQVRTPTGRVFHTFVQPVSEKFVPKLNDEHSGFTWAPLDALPGPIHPAVQSTLDRRIGVAKDMQPEEWQGLRDGFLKWTAEEEAEPEHAEDICATDTALRLAMDQESAREYSADGHLHVKRTPISKATVNPYRGEEIPDYEKLGLEKDQIYHLLRDAQELAKAAPTFNGKPLLMKHKPLKATDHPKDLTIGATGNTAEFEHPYLYNSLSVWPQEDIDDIESELKKELSSGYRYRADMTPGVFDGMRYDGVMRDIVGNHVALVKDGRAGPDVVVCDSMESLMAKPTRIAGHILSLVAANIAPLIAMDQKIVLPKDLFAPITTKNIKELKPALLAGVRKAADGKLRKGVAMDSSMEHVGKVMDAVSELFDGEKGADESVSEPQHKAMEAAAHGESDLDIPASVGEEYVAKDAEPLKAFLKEKGMDEESIKKACDLMPKSMAGDESEEDKKKREEAEKKAADAKAELEAKDAAMKDMVTKPAMDAAIDSAVKKVRADERGIRTALAAVHPFVGELPATMALDSADDVYRAAAVALKIPDADKIHASALPTLINLCKPAGARAVETPMALDAAQTASFATRYPDAGRIKTVA